MEYLRKCYRGRVRLFIDDVPTVVPIRWYFTDRDAPFFPFSHCWGSQVYKTYLDYDQGDPRELDGFEHASNRNPGYRHKCFLGDKAWWQSGRIPAAALVNPPPIPPCCYTRQEEHVAGLFSLRLCVASRFRGGAAILPAVPTPLQLQALGSLAEALEGALGMTLDVAAGVVGSEGIGGALGMALDVAAGVVGSEGIGGPLALTLAAVGQLAAAAGGPAGLTLTLDVAAGLVGAGVAEGPLALTLANLGAVVGAGVAEGPLTVSLAAVGQLAAVIRGQLGLRLGMIAGVVGAGLAEGQLALTLGAHGAVAISASGSGHMAKQLGLVGAMSVATPAPGVDCLHAGPVGIGQTAGPQTISGGTDWWKLTVTPGTQYHVTFTLISGSIGTWHVFDGSCSGLNPIADGTGTQCLAFTPSTSTIWVEIVASLFASGTYKWVAGAGPC